MQDPKVARYFENNLPDYSHGATKLSEEEIKNSIDEIVASILENYPSNDSRARRDVYVGTAGVAYMFYHLSKIPALRKMKQIYLQNALEYIQNAIETSRHEKRDRQLAFISGNAGVYAVAAVIFHALGIEKHFTKYRDKYFDLAKICKSSSLDIDDNELFVGRAGYLCGVLWLAEETNTSLPLNDLYDICNAMIVSGRNYAKNSSSRPPLMYSYHDREYLGAAHGLCAILLMFLNIPGYLETYPAEAKDVRASVDYFLSLQTKNGNFPTKPNESRVELVHWCHGAPGVVYLMAKAYFLWKEEKYLRSCEKSANLVWDEGLLRKGPGICHGVAGNGYVFLLMYRLTKKPMYLHRAMSFAQFMNSLEFKSHARTPDRPYSMFEGIAGAACYLADLTQPEEAYFPFFNIF